MSSTELLTGNCLDVLKTLAPRSVQTCVTSPPYYHLRDYESAEQLGTEASPAEYIANLVTVFRLVREALKDDGTLWINIGDSYADRPIAGTAIKAKDLIGIPWMLGFALRDDGWWLRQDIVWQKANPYPESITDRCTKAHEYIFLLSKQRTYRYDRMAIAEPAIYAEQHARKATSWGKKKLHVSKNNIEKYQLLGTDNNKTCLPGGKRNKRSVWTVKVQPYKGAHMATYPEDLIKPCILAATLPGDTVLDPFSGAGTTGVVAKSLDRNYVGIELNPHYIVLAMDRIRRTPGFFDDELLLPDAATDILDDWEYDQLRADLAVLLQDCDNG